MAMKPDIIREPVMIQARRIYLKATFLGSLTTAQSISNRIGSDFNIDSAITEAKRLDVFEEFKEARHLCHEIEKEVERRHRLLFPLYPPITCVFEGDFYLIERIEYIPHEESNVMIAKLKFKLS